MKLFSSYTLGADKIAIFINLSTVEGLPDFKYLESTLVNNSWDSCSQRCFLFCRAKPFRNRCDISLKTKVPIYLAKVRIVSIYSWQTWPIRVADIRKPSAFDYSCLSIKSAKRICKESHDCIQLRSDTIGIKIIDACTSLATFFDIHHLTYHYLLKPWFMVLKKFEPTNLGEIQERHWTRRLRNLLP